MQHSPPNKTKSNLDEPNIKIHYNSDSALNVVGVTDVDDNFNITKRLKRTLSDLKNQPASSTTEIKTMFTELKSQQEHKFELINNTMLTIMNQNQDIQKSILIMASNHEQLLKKISVLEQENLDYKNRVSTLEKQLEVVEKHARNSSLEIRNLPREEKETKITLKSTVKNICITLGLETSIQDAEIRDIYRSRSEAIVVEFTTTLRKENIVSKYKIHNKTRRDNREPQLNTEHINMPGPPRMIFISERLTSKVNRVFFLARENVRNKKLVAAWTSYGKVYVKKDDASPPTRIDEDSDLFNLIK